MESGRSLPYALAMKLTLLLLVFMLSTPVVAAGQGRSYDAPVSYRCGDLVVIGRFENLDYEPTVEIEGDLIGHGWFTARVRVRRVVAGRAEGRVVAVRYFAHTYYRDDREFVLVINRAEPDRNVIRSAHLIDGRRRPRLARSCN